MQFIRLKILVDGKSFKLVCLYGIEKIDILLGQREVVQVGEGGVVYEIVSRLSPNSLKKGLGDSALHPSCLQDNVQLHVGFSLPFSSFLHPLHLYYFPTHPTPRVILEITHVTQNIIHAHFISLLRK